MKNKSNITKELLKYINQNIRKGYAPILKIEEIDALINKIYCWYEIKSLEINLEDSAINKLINLITMNELINILNHEEQRFLKCDYQAFVRRYKDNSPIMTVSLFYNKRSYDFITIEFYPETGLICDIGSISFTDIDVEESSKQISLEELLNYINHEYEGVFNTKPLEKIIETRKFNIAIRNKVLEIVLNKLFTSGSFKAFNYFKKDIDEYLKSLSQTTLKTDKILKKSLV